MVRNIEEIISQVTSEIDEKWTAGRLRKISFLIDDRLLLESNIPIKRPTRTAFFKGYKHLFIECQPIECVHEAIRRTVIVLDYCSRPEYYQLKENYNRAIQLGKHQQYLQDQREEKGLLGKTVPKGKRDGKKPKVDYSVWTVKKK